MGYLSVHPNVDRLVAFVLTVAFGLVYLALPHQLTPFPDWLPVSLLIFVEMPLIVTIGRKWHPIKQLLGYVAVLIMTAFLILSVFMFVQLMLRGDQSIRKELLPSGALLWGANILVFAIWYWRYDGGGPHFRIIEGHDEGSFLFPQMLLSEPDKKRFGQEGWAPNIIDYLFLAFNTSTAFSPTDSPVMNRPAKVLMMVQSCISLTIVVVLFGRAVNVL